jgi:hypothetical protein
MTMMSHPGLDRRGWCAKVGTLCAPGLADKASASIALYLPDLEHFPDACFTAESARAVSRHPRKMAVPSFDEVEAALRQFRSTYVWEPPRPALAAPQAGREPPTESEKAAVAGIMAGWRQERAANPRSAEDERPALKPWKDPTEGMTPEQKRTWRQARGLYVPPEDPE